MHANSQPDDTIDVTTTAGTVRGFWRGDSAAFLGVPYAQPPVGALRFAAPVPHAPWEGVRDATAYGPTPQRKTLSEVTIIPEPSIPGDSTLSVNVFTPAPERTQTGGLPVLVYIHGGGFVAGSAASPWYDGAAFNRDGVVVVTLSYRLGFDGFGVIADAPHNRGVLDWLLALQWVSENIRSFGGDPGRVTIAGQSAGGAAVLTLLGMPQAQGLFYRAHCVSGPAADVSLDRAEALGRRLAELGGVPPTRAGLASLSEDRVLELQKQVAPVAQQGGDPLPGLIDLLSGGLPLGPVVDGELLAVPTLEALRSGVGADKELVLGANDHEFNMVLTRAPEKFAAVAPETVLSQLGCDEQTAAAYVTDHAALDTAGVVGQFVTDCVFRATAVRVVQARGAAPTWLYRFAWRSAVSREAMHCLDMPFYFDCLGADGVTAITGAEPPQALADDVHGAAVAFIRDGHPGWPACAALGEVAAQVFDTPSHVAADGYADVRQPLAVTS